MSQTTIINNNLNKLQNRDISLVMMQVGILYYYYYREQQNLIIFQFDTLR